MRLLSVSVIALLLLVAGCGGEENVQNADSAKQACATKPVNPNGDSELAILMREMANWSDSCKATITSGRTIPAKPEKLNTLHTAKRTDEAIDETLFHSMASLYQNKVSEFEKSTVENKTEMFNAMVGACVSCHENFCQGPLVRINKMLIPIQ